MPKLADHVSLRFSIIKITRETANNDPETISVIALFVPIFTLSWEKSQILLIGATGLKIPSVMAKLQRELTGTGAFGLEIPRDRDGRFEAVLLKSDYFK